MISSNSTEALVALEDASPEVLFSKIPGTDIHMWPLLRWLIARSAARSELNTVPVPRQSSTVSKLLRVATASIPNEFSANRVNPNTEFLFVVNGGTYVQTENGRKNWLVGDHASLLGDRASILQDMAIAPWAPTDQRPSFRNTFSFERSIVQTEAAARRHPLRRDEVSYIRDVANEVFAQLDVNIPDDLREATRRTLLGRCARASHSRTAFARIVDKLPLRAVFMQTASYGDRAHFIRLLKERGVLVLEHQHGWIGPSHAAYNFGAAMRTEELGAYLPDVLLAFGDLWKSQIRFPHRVISVGKPHLERMADRSLPVESRAKDLLVVSSVLEPERMEAFTLSLRKSLPEDWRVVFRPHPSERASVKERYSALVDRPGVEFDVNTDVYDSLSSSRAVAGYASTVLYEALAFDCHVMVKDSGLTPLYIANGLFGEPIKDDPDSLSRAIQELLRPAPHQDAGATGGVSRVWQPDAEASFLRLIESI